MQKRKNAPNVAPVITLEPPIILRCVRRWDGSSLNYWDGPPLMSVEESKNRTYDTPVASTWMSAWPAAGA